MKGYIYKVTNKVNGLSYIGQTRYTVEFRWRQHQHKYDNTYLHNAIQKYGADNFIVETLEECDVKDLDSREIFYISEYNTFEEGYNLTIGGGGKRKIVSDNQYDEIKELYLSGFSTYKIAELYGVSRVTITKILKILGVKIKDKGIHINLQEFNELVEDYKTGYSLKQLAKRYDCSAQGLKEYLMKKGVDLRERYSLLNDEDSQNNMIREYLDGSKMEDLQRKYHCEYSTFMKVLSMHGIKPKGRGSSTPFKLTEKQCLEVIRLFGEGVKVKDLAKQFEVSRHTIYSLFKRYYVNYLTV